MFVSCPKGRPRSHPYGLRHLRAVALCVTLAQAERFTITELCSDFGISRKTGHKYLQRYEAEGREGLGNRSRRPKSSPSATADDVEKLILKERRKHPSWGAKKIHDLLLKVHGIEDRPHINTVNNVLSRHGMTKKRKRRAGLHRVRPEHLTEPTRPNEVWTFDFKGWFTLYAQKGSNAKYKDFPTPLTCPRLPGMPRKQRIEYPGAVYHPAS